MPTIRDVAKLAGVAPITASRVINNSGYASDEVRQRVEQAAEQLGYVPNIIARSLRSRKTHTLALVLTDITNPFWTTVARGVEDAAHEAGFNLILCNSDESPQKQENYLETLIQKRVDGILLVPVESDPEQVSALDQQKVPYVLLDRPVPGVQADQVWCDSEDGANQLVKSLISQGHTRIAFLGGPEEVATTSARLQGYRRALKEAGLGKGFEIVYFGKFSLESGYEMTKKAITCQPAPSAIFASNNFIAIGALRAFHDCGVAVPEDISIVGFDDLPTAMIVRPFLTAAVQPAYLMGHMAAEYLLKRLTGKAKHAFKSIVLPVEIIHRNSTRRL